MHKVLELVVHERMSQGKGVKREEEEEEGGEEEEEEEEEEGTRMV